jgi:ATP-dependent RNA helicase RhlB
MNEPEKLVVETESITAARVRQRIYFPSDEEKLTLLLGLLSRSEGARTMVFVNTKAFVERVARSLERNGYRVGVLSGDVPQKKRETLLNRFQKGQLEILVATDVAARGLHIDGVKYVYNYDLPFDAEDYVHRIGRTARLGEEGDAISFACERYAMSLPDIEAYIEQKIPVEPVTAELLVALPRTPRAPVEGEAAEADADGDESIGDIFREARAQREADEQRRGGGRGKPGGGRSGPGGRGEARGADGKPRRPRTPRPAEAGATAGAVAETAAAGADANEAVAAAPVAAPKPRPPRPAADGAPAVEGERPPRKRRRRRGGRPLEGAEGAAASVPTEAPAKPVQVVATPVKAARQGDRAAAPAAAANDSFLTRLGRKLRSLVSSS